MIAATPSDILNLLLRGAAEGVDGVLITLTGIEGTSSRAIGTQMAVLADGRHAGSFSGGCIEAAVVAEALDALACGEGRQIRYGAGSPYIDIRLPCGGGIDLLFTPRPDAAAVGAALARLDSRRPAALALDRAGGCRMDGGRMDRGRMEQAGRPGWRGDSFLRWYAPPLRLAAIGQGEDLAALSRLALAFGLDVEAWAPATDGLVLDPIIRLHAMASRSVPPAIASDPWTAIVLLFHDHDWEEALLPHVLALPAFYHGAIGSRRTHRARIDMLRAQGVAEARIDALRGSIGLIPATRDPATLALSILAELVQDYQACAGAPGWTGLAVPALLPGTHGPA